MTGKTKYVCFECEKLIRTNGSHKWKDKILCGRCWVKKVTICSGPATNRGLTIEQALKKTYTPKTYVSKYTQSGYCSCSFPKVLAGKSFKIKLVENNNGNVEKK